MRLLEALLVMRGREVKSIVFDGSNLCYLSVHGLILLVVIGMLKIGSFLFPIEKFEGNEKRKFRANLLWALLTIVVAIILLWLANIVFSSL